MKSRMGRNPFEKPAQAKVVKAKVQDTRASSAASASCAQRTVNRLLVDVPATAITLGLKAAFLVAGLIAGNSRSGGNGRV